MLPWKEVVPSKVLALAQRPTCSGKRGPERGKWRKDGEGLVCNRQQEQMWKLADDLGCTLLPIWAGEEQISE